MGRTCWRRLGAVHVAQIAWLLSNVAILESIRPLDQSQDKALPKRSFVEVETHHQLLTNTNKSRPNQASIKGGIENPARPGTPTADPAFTDEWTETGGADNAVSDNAESEVGTNLDPETLPSGAESTPPAQVAEDRPPSPVVHRVGSLGPRTYSSADGNVGGRAMDLLGEKDDLNGAAENFDPHKARARAVGNATADPLYVDVRKTEPSHREASLTANVPRENHYREFLDLQPTVLSAVDTIRRTLGNAKAKGDIFVTKLDNSLVKMKQLQDRLKDVNLEERGLQLGIHDESRSTAVDVVDPFHQYNNDGAEGGSHGQKWVPESGQWTVFNDLLQETSGDQR